MPFIGRLLATTAPLAFAATAAHADVVISSRATQNMSCSSGICVPTATAAVLNVSDLENLLAAGNLDILTTNGSIQADNIDIASSLSLSGAGSLTLDAYQSISFAASVGRQGTGGVAILTNDGGSGGVLTFAFGHGQLSFADDSEPLSINGKIYHLVNTLEQLALAIASDPAGRFALSHDTNAGKGQLYYNPPIPLPFTGAFNGLGHAITNLSIVDLSDSEVGLFAVVKKGSVASVSLRHALVRGHGDTGALAGTNEGTISNAFVSGRVYSKSLAAGLVGANSGTLTASQSAASVDAKYAGGIVGDNNGTVVLSFATGNVSGTRVGGLVAVNDASATIENSYASGSVTGTLDVGGLEGYNIGSVSASYSTGAVNGTKQRASVGGFEGYNSGADSNCYWDTDSSGTEQGIGNGNNAGLTGLTTDQLQSGLPAGFDPAVWAEDSKVNDGLPYLIANPPPN